MRERVTIGFGFTSDWTTKWRNFLKANWEALPCRAKANSSWNTLDTQWKPLQLYIAIVFSWAFGSTSQRHFFIDVIPSSSYLSSWYNAVLRETACWLLRFYSFGSDCCENLIIRPSMQLPQFWRNISDAKDRVRPPFQTPRRELKMRRAAEFFWRTSRCLEMWSSTVLSVWYIFSIETKTKEKTEK